MKTVGLARRKKEMRSKYYFLIIVLLIALPFFISNTVQGQEKGNDQQLSSIDNSSATYINLMNRLYSHSFTSNSALYVVDPENGSTTLLGYTGIADITDIAFSKNNILYGITFSDLIYIDPYTGTGRIIGNLGFSNFNSLVTSPNGIIYSASYDDGKFIRIDENTGKGTLIGYYGPGLTSSGDLIFDSSGNLYATIKRSGYSNDWLAVVDPNTGTVTELKGDTGFQNIWGLSIRDEIFYGVTYSGQLIQIDPQTGSGTLIGTSGGIAHGGLTTTPKLPLLDLPISYTNFFKAAQGNIATGTGRVNSWFDHNVPSPFAQYNDHLLAWTGYPEIIGTLKLCDKGKSCYDNHEGVDFSKLVLTTTEYIYAVAPGIVTGTVSNCPIEGEDPQKCGNGYGNQVWIDQGNGYFTLYGHLETVSVEKNDVLDNLSFRTQALGTMGTTGHSTGPHLHFGVYYNPNKQHLRSYVIDPYGWFDSQESDPWVNAANKSSVSMWKYPAYRLLVANDAACTINSPTGYVQADFSAGTFISDTLIQLIDIPPIAGASSQLRSVGTSFWLKIIPDSLDMNGRTYGLTGINDLNKPVNLSVFYNPQAIRHLDEATLSIYYWNDTLNIWEQLPSTVDSALHLVKAQSPSTGKFDVQGELACSNDPNEPNDEISHANWVTSGLFPGSFEFSNDDDWYWIEGKAGVIYTFDSVNLAPDVDPYLELYDVSGETLLASDDNSGSGNGFRLTWKPENDATLFLKVMPVPSSFTGCTATYNLQITARYSLYLPSVVK